MRIRQHLLPLFDFSIVLLDDVHGHMNLPEGISHLVLTVAGRLKLFLQLLEFLANILVQVCHVLLRAQVDSDEALVDA